MKKSIDTHAKNTYVTHMDAAHEGCGTGVLQAGPVLCGLISQTSAHGPLDRLAALRGVAQMVARTLWEREDAGSTPATPTTGDKYGKRLQ